MEDIFKGTGLKEFPGQLILDQASALKITNI
jgi:hypothetical protein